MTRLLSNTYVNIIIVLMFFSLLAVCISLFFRSSPNMNNIVMEGLSHQFQQNLEISYWQWQAQGRPERIMLLHYHSDGRERARTPLKMQRSGKPWVDENAQGCEMLWSNLLSEPRQINGFNVISEFYLSKPDPRTNENEKLGYCRYRLSRGTHFDYYFKSGKVEFAQ